MAIKSPLQGVVVKIEWAHTCEGLSRVLGNLIPNMAPLGSIFLRSSWSLRKKTPLLLGVKGTCWEQVRPGALGEPSWESMAAAFPAFWWQSFCHLPAQEGQFLNEVIEPLLGCLCKTFKVNSSPERRLGWMEAKFTGWMEASLSRCNKCKMFSACDGGHD